VVSEEKRLSEIRYQRSGTEEKRDGNTPTGVGAGAVHRGRNTESTGMRGRKKDGNTEITEVGTQRAQR
jgi:hypothetical protein